MVSSAGWAMGCASAPAPSAAELDFEIPERFAAVETSTASVDAAWWRDFDDPRLDALVEEAIAENQDLRLAMARLDAAAVQARIAGVGVYPRIDAQLGVQRQKQLFLGFPDDIFPGAGPGGEDDDAPLSSEVTLFEASLQASWEIDLWGRVRSARSAALGALQASEAEMEAARLSIVGQVVGAYFGLVRIERLLVLAHITAANRQERVETVAKRYEQGLAPAVELRLAQSDWADSRAQVIEMTGRRTAAQRRLEILLGRYPAGDIEVRDVLPSPPPPPPIGLPSLLLLRRADLVAAERRLASAGARIDAAEAALFPRISLTGAIGLRSEELKNVVDPDFSFWNFAANLLQPIFRGGELRARVDLVEAEQKQAIAEYVRSVLLAFQEVENALTAEETEAARLLAIAEAAEQAVAARNSATRSYILGVEDFLSVLEADARAYRTAQRLIDARYARLEARIDLYLALGGGFSQVGPPEESG